MFVYRVFIRIAGLIGGMLPWPTGLAGQDLLLWWFAAVAGRVAVLVGVVHAVIVVLLIVLQLRSVASFDLVVS